ncbi:hypothetical protein [Mycolicibacterium peregrinum]|uniref:hypothetical protein n=1 Tax=Mycolicibacterium peregrinum TaxID=43304 RepID=UPI003AB102C9
MEQHSDGEKVLVLWCEVCAYGRHQRAGLQAGIAVDSGLLVDVASVQRSTRPGQMSVERFVVGQVPQCPQDVFHSVPAVVAGIASGLEQGVAAGEAFFGVAHDRSACLLKLESFVVAEFVER